MKKLILIHILLISLLITAPVLAEQKYYYDFSGGLNDKVSPLLVRDNEATAIQNITFATPGSIKKRTGYTIFASTPVVTGFPITGIYDYQMEGGTSYLIATSSKTVSKWDSSALDWTVLRSTMTCTSSDYYDFDVFQDTCIITNGVDVPQKWIVGTGTLEDLDTGTHPDDWRPNYASLVEIWDDRVWFGGTMADANAGVTDTLTYNRVRFSSDYGTTKFEGADAWPPSYYFDFYEDTNVTGMETLQDKLVVFGLDNIFLVGGTNPTNYFRALIVSGTGCISDRTIKNVENEVYFLAPTGHIYAFDGASVRLLSDKISTTINGLNKNVLDKACAEVYPKYHQYWLSVATGSSATNNLILVYDYRLNAWTKYSGINASYLAQRKVSDVVKLYSGDSGTDSYLYTQDTGNNDNDSAIDAYIKTKYFGGDFPEYDKTFDSMYVLADMLGDYNVKVKYDLDFGRSSREVNMSLYTSGALFDVAVFGVDVFAGEVTKYEKIPINKTGNFIQFKFANEYADEPFTIPGFSIKYENLELR